MGAENIGEVICSLHSLLLASLVFFLNHEDTKTRRDTKLRFEFILNYVLKGLFVTNFVILRVLVSEASDFVVQKM